MPFNELLVCWDPLAGSEDEGTNHAGMIFQKSATVRATGQKESLRYDVSDQNGNGCKLMQLMQC